MIRVNSVSKTYHVWKEPLSRLLVPIAARFLRPFMAKWYSRFAAQHCQPVKALQQVNFELQRGDSLGIIGLNGSGKSTLLQVIAGTLQPTTGHVEVSGRVAALLELGSGFNPEFSGRENVYLNAAILGLTTAEIEARYQDIVDFANIGEFIDRPVKTYSSGMVLRLAFAVQVHVEPDVLIVDEALAVGDAQFQARALNKIEEILDRGTTLLFVGHDLAAVKSFCNRAMLLDKGKVIREGIPDDVIADYLYFVQRDKLAETGRAESLQKKRNGFAAKGFDVVSASFLNVGEHTTLRFGETVAIDIRILVSEPVSHPYLILDVIDSKGLQLTGKRIAIPSSVGEHALTIKMNCSFQKGVYRFRIRLVNAPNIEQTVLMSRYDDLLSLEMIDDVRDQFTGLFPVPLSYDWSTDIAHTSD